MTGKGLKDGIVFRINRKDDASMFQAGRSDQVASKNKRFLVRQAEDLAGLGCREGGCQTSGSNLSGQNHVRIRILGHGHIPLLPHDDIWGVILREQGVELLGHLCGQNPEHGRPEHEGLFGQKRRISGPGKACDLKALGMTFNDRDGVGAYGSCAAQDGYLAWS
jgi:hypothetical protein